MVRAPDAAMKRHHHAALWLLWGCAWPAWSVAADRATALPPPAAPVVPPARAGVADKTYDFDIPAQSLETALIRYGVVSGHPALFPSDIVTGRTSTALQGVYSAEQALRHLLDGTGLRVDRMESDLGVAFVLKQADPDDVPAAAAPAGVAALMRDQTYPALVQTRIWQALCADVRTAPGRYRALFRFQVDGDGHVNSARLLRSSGQARRDAAIVDILQRVRIGRAPPPALVQHRLSMLLLPDDPQGGASCAKEQEH